MPMTPEGRRAQAAGPAYWCAYAWVDGTVAEGVVVTTDAGGLITGVRTGAGAPPPGTEPLPGLTLPGLANAHSHAFHRALRGAVQVGPGTFWTWRETMYAVAERLTPESYFALARAVYAEMALAGITCVGEFHYLHHAPGGAPYEDPNAMGHALVAAAAEAGIRITLLDTAYLAAGFGREGRGEPPGRQQLRFSDGTAEAWAERASAVRATGGHARTGAAIHSVRAVPARELATVAAWAEERSAPLHVHLSEQTAENDACVGAHGCTPTRLLADHGVLGRRTTAVHATHLTGDDIGLLGGAAAGVCMCPTTERDLADGIGPAPGSGSGRHAVPGQRQPRRHRPAGGGAGTGAGRAAAHPHPRPLDRRPQLLRAATGDGHAALGWPEAGRLERGAQADFTTLTLDSVRTAGSLTRTAAETAVFAATAADVRHTVVGGRHIVKDGRHAYVPDVPGALTEAIRALH